MRAYEFLQEGKPGKISKRAQRASKGIEGFRDAGGYDRVYHLNRVMMAAAMADGKSKSPVDMDQASWSEKYNTAHPYTDEEHNMLHQALATVPSDHHAIVSRSKSTEASDTHKISPVSGFKGYKRK